jgi:hypothetical protein
VPQSSWWDNPPEKKVKKEGLTAKKTSFPETGKYVMVNRRIEKGKDEQQQEIATATSANKAVELPTTE